MLQTEMQMWFYVTFELKTLTLSWKNYSFQDVHELTSGIYENENLFCY